MNSNKNIILFRFAYIEIRTCKDRWEQLASFQECGVFLYLIFGLDKLCLM